MAAAPGVADTEVSRLELPESGLATVDQAEPFQFRVRVCGVVNPDGSSWPTAHTSPAELAETPVRTGAVPGDGLGTMLQLVPL